MIDPNYTAITPRLDFTKETRLVDTSEEVTAWIEKRFPGRFPKGHQKFKFAFLSALCAPANLLF